MRKREEIQSAFAHRDELNQYQRFFLVGIGGAGMLGVARLLLREGFQVSGTDAVDSPSLERLREEGAAVTIGHTGAGIEPATAVILTDAIDLDSSPEVARARELGLPLFRRSQALGWLVRNHKVIAVTGTHGKTTTTGMIGAGLLAAGLDPLIVVGAEVPDFGGAVVYGKGSYAVIEACEAYDSFHDLDPEIAVLTNLEPDHLDFHGTYESLKESVHRFLSRSKKGVIFAASDPGAAEMAASLAGTSEGYTSADVPLSADALALPGEHNRTNAAAAIKVARWIGADETLVAKGLAGFGGASRRLQVLKSDGPVVMDDYAHHPTEIDASIAALRERYPNRRLVVVFQPHLYSRTQQFVPEFADALSKADMVVITDIYPAREAPIPGVSSALIAEKLTVPHLYVPVRHLLPETVAGMILKDDVVVGMGAGNIESFAPDLVSRLHRTTGPKVWVVIGGDSAEREVSLNSGRAVAEGLRSRGHDVELVDVTEILLNKKGSLLNDRPDVAVLQVHGSNAEDGAIQGFFELYHVPYSGSGIQSSAMAMDKNLTKLLLESVGIPVPQGKVVRSGNEDLTLPGVSRYVVKPNAQGSTVGLSFVESVEALRPAVEKALLYSETALIEEWVVGVEISVPVLDTRVLDPVEIIPRLGQYDFANKYTPGATEEICPARLTPAQTEIAKRQALLAHQTMRCSGATRTDMIVTEDRIVALEVNTLPGMTPTSLLPLAAKTAGISFPELCEWLMEDALQRHGR